MAAQKWISVKDRLPDVYDDGDGNTISERVLGIDSRGRQEIVRFLREGGRDWWLDNRTEPVEHLITHWMPLPAPPKEDVER